MCVYVCVSKRERERERERDAHRRLTVENEHHKDNIFFYLIYTYIELLSRVFLTPWYFLLSCKIKNYSLNLSSSLLVITI